MPYRSLAALAEARRTQASAADELLGDGLGQLLAGLYTENAHFVFELLQNAEDARASEVEFDLKASRLVFTHNGADPFTLADIESITTIKSTKRDDDTKIGKFGVGFKAVFSYTSRPEIRSGEFAFAIENLFVPVPLTANAEGASTVFTLPFDRTEKPKQLAHDEIAQRLHELDESTLLFLRSIRSIRYRLSDGTSGRITRDEGEYPFVSITRKTGRESETSHWLRLEGGPKLSALVPKDQMVSAAFRLDGSPTRTAAKPGRQKAVKLEPITNGATCVYFPAAAERSRLKFHIHAPFAPTPSRDSVKQGSENDELFDAIGRLVAGELPRLRDDGWIANGLLDALPNPEDQLEPRYAAIRNRIVEGFREHKVTPVVKGGHAKASDLVDSPSEFRTAFDLSDLAFLTRLVDEDYPAKPKWVVERPGRAGKFLSGLGIAPFGWDELNDVFGAARYEHEEWRGWLHRRPVDRLRAFYELLGQGFEESAFLYAYNINGFTGPLIRVRDGRKTEIVSPARTYLPTTPQDTTPGRVPASLAYFDGDEHSKGKARLQAFYAGFKVRRWDERAQVEERLATYRNKRWPEAKTHLADLRLFVAYLTSSPRDTSMFTSGNFVKIVYPGEDSRWTNPSLVFLDKPYRTTGLAKVYTTTDGPFLLHPSYRGKVAGLEEFVMRLGAVDAVKIESANPRHNPQWKSAWHPYNRQETSNGWKTDCDIPAIPEILASKDKMLLRSLWTALSTTDASDVESAYFQLNGQTTLHPMDSQLVQRLTVPWVLDRRGRLRYPETVSLDDLPEGWPEPRPGSLAVALGFGADARARDEEASERRRVAAEAGISVELLDALNALPEAERKSAMDDMIAQLTARRTFPTNRSANPERRAAILAEDAPSAPEHSTAKRSRSVVLGRFEATDLAKQYLEGEYTDDSGAMRCQGCQQTMPFRKPDGRWYFEAIRYLPKRAQSHRENALAMCPLCAALYSHARSTPDSLLLAEIREQTAAALDGRVVVPVTMNERVVELFFTERHARDLVTVLTAAGSARA